MLWYIWLHIKVISYPLHKYNTSKCILFYIPGLLAALVADFGLKDESFCVYICTALAYEAAELVLYVAGLPAKPVLSLWLPEWCEWWDLESLLDVGVLYIAVGLKVHS